MERLAPLFEDVDEVRVVLDREARFTWANAAAQRFFGGEEPILGRALLEFAHPDQREFTRAAFAAWLEGNGAEAAELENKHVSVTGATHDIVWTVRPLRDARDHVVGFACSARDISAHRRTELELLKSQARAQAILSSILDPMVSIDERGTIQLASDSVERVFGYTPEELVGRNVNVLMPEPHRTHHDEYLEHYRQTGQTGIIGRTREFEVVRKDGSRLVCGLSVSRADPADGQDAVFTGTFRDVTELRRATQSLADSERRFHAIFDQSFQFVGLLGPDGSVLEANLTALDLIGATRADVVGRKFWETGWWRAAPDVQARIRTAVEAAARGEFVRFETQVRGRDGRIEHVDFSLKPVQDEAGRVVLLIPEGRNITEIKRVQRAETAMLRALASIGESAEILTHEIKNPITAVNVALRAVAAELGEDHREVLEDLVTRMQRIESMMQRTLSFAKPIDLNETVCDVHELFASVVRQLEPEISRTESKVDSDLRPGGLRIRCDAHLLQDVIVNLVTNAIESGRSGTRIVLDAALLAGGEVAIGVEDDGPGVPDSLAESLFKPFVSTKRKGNGLGLAICRKIVEEHGGTITVQRGRLCGARFEIVLPPERRIP